MLIKKTLPAVQAMPNMQAAFCQVTGISYGISLPGGASAVLRDYALPGGLPLAKWDCVRGYARLGMVQLEQLDKETLAGLVIAGFQHWSMLDRGELSAPEANAILRTAHKTLLARMLRMLAYITPDKAAGLPMLFLDWADFRDEQTADRRLRAHIDRIGPILDQEMREAAAAAARKADQTEAAYQAVLRIQGHKGRILAGGVYLSAKTTLAGQGKELDEKLKHARKALRMAAADLYAVGVLTGKQADMLAELTKGRALITMAQDSRDKIIAKLQGMPASRALSDAIKALQDTRPPENYQQALTSELDGPRVAEPEQGQTVKRSIADILRAKAGQ